MNQEILDISKYFPNLNARQIEDIIMLFQNGHSVEYIFRYKKDSVGNINYIILKNLLKRYNQNKNLNSMKNNIFAELKNDDKPLPAYIIDLILNTKDEIVLEDNAQTARDILQSDEQKSPIDSLVNTILTQKQIKTDKTNYLKTFINNETGFGSIEKILSEAHKILVDKFKSNIKIRQLLRERILEVGEIESRVRELYFRKKTKYEHFYDFRKKIRDLFPEEFFAINKGFEEGVLSFRINFFHDSMINYIERHIIRNENNLFKNEFHAAFKDCYKKFILPSIQKIVLKKLKRNCENNIISTICKRFREVISKTPAGNVAVLGVVPTLKEGAKIAVINPAGELVDYFTIHPLFSQSRALEAKNLICELIDKYNIKYISISGENGSLELEKFFGELILEKKNKNIGVLISEKYGAESYSNSEIVKTEFPHLDNTFRSALYIARKLQNPLNEIAKLDFTKIKLHPFQFDIDQDKLESELKQVFIEYICETGIDVNRANEYLLSYIPGLNKEIGEGIVKHRQVFGAFKSREDLKNVPKVSHQSFKESVGFLFISESSNPLDKMFIHPDIYYIVKRISDALLIPIPNLIKNKNILKIDPNALADDKFGVNTIKYLIDEIKEPTSDNKRKFMLPKVNYTISAFDDLKEGMTIEGKITNIAQFGIFCDIGLENKALLHISEIPLDIYFDSLDDYFYIGQILHVEIIQIDKERKRINLSLQRI